MKVGLKIGIALSMTALTWGVVRMYATSNPATAVLLARSASMGQSDHSADVGSEPVEHGLSAKPVEIARPLGLPVTNSMLVSWIVAVALILLAQAGTRAMTMVPAGLQNFVEWLVEGLHTFMVGIIGSHLADRTFWFFATIFIFILSANWVGLI